MHDNFLQITFSSFRRCFYSTYGGWVNGQFWKTNVSSVYPPRTLTRFQSSICMCVCVWETKQALAFRPVCLVKVWNLLVHVEGVWRCAFRQSSCSQSERICQARPNEQRLDLWPDGSICKMTPQALFWGRCPQMMKENIWEEDETRCCFSLGFGRQPPSAGLGLFYIFAGWRNVVLWFQRLWIIIIRTRNLWCNI